MTNKLLIIFIIQAIVAFMIIVTLNYYALKLSLGWSILGGLGFILIVGLWASYRLKNYRNKQAKSQKKNDSDES